MIWGEFSVGVFGFLWAREVLLPVGALYDPNLKLSFSDAALDIMWYNEHTCVICVQTNSS